MIHPHSNVKNERRKEIAKERKWDLSYVMFPWIELEEEIKVRDAETNEDRTKPQGKHKFLRNNALLINFWILLWNRFDREMFMQPVV